MCGPRHCDSQFERHVEPRHARRFAIKLSAGQIMNGEAATLDKIENPLQAPRTRRYSQGGSGHKAEDGQAYDVGDIEPFKLGIVRDVEKYGVWFNALSWHC